MLQLLAGAGALAALPRVPHAVARVVEGNGVGAVPWPPIVPRTAWDPDGTCVPAERPQLGPAIRHVIVHHTQVFASYERDEAPGLVHNLCESHVGERGFDDLGYHLIVDRYGAVYEGRAGGLTRPVLGAHAQGFNHGTVGVALMGDFDVDPVPEAARASLVRVVAWLSRLHGFDPTATLPNISTGGPKSRFEEGEAFEARAVLAHREVGRTSCPGRHLAAYVESGALLADVLAELEATGGHGSAVAPAPVSDAGVPSDPSGGEPDERDSVVDRIADVVERLITPRVLRP